MKLILIIIAALFLSACDGEQQSARFAPVAPTAVATETPFRARAWFRYRPKADITPKELAALAPYPPGQVWDKMAIAANTFYGDTVVSMTTDQYNELGDAGRHLERLPERTK